MFRTYQVLFNRILLFLDSAILVLSFLLAWYIKFNSGWLPSGGHLPLRNYMVAVFFAIVIFLFSNTFAGLYKPMRSQSIRSEFINIIKSVILGLLVFMSALYFLKLVQFSRDVIVIFTILFVTLTLCERALMRSLLRFMRTRGFNQKFILIVGWNQAINRFVFGLEKHPWFGYRILGYLSVDNNTFERGGLECLGTIKKMENILQNQLVDHVVIALPRGEAEIMAEVTRVTDQLGIQSLILPDYFDLLPARPRFESFAGMPLIDTRYVPLDDALNAFTKRAFDIVFSFFVLIILSPLFLLIGTIIKISSEGPIFYVQERVGKNRRVFKMYKFRSMHLDQTVGDNDGWTHVNDPRRTKIGAFLRHTSLDELPQFWNVLIGDMSVIGPRPERPYYVEQFRGDIPRYMVKHRIRPGITGWAQVNGWRGDTSITERIRYDIEYIENWSFEMDLKIVWKTVIYGFVNTNAY